MIGHKNIILPLGTMFLLIALKIHNITARTISDIQHVSSESSTSISPSSSSSFEVPNLNNPLLSSVTLVDYVSLMKNSNQTVLQTDSSTFSSTAEISDQTNESKQQGSEDNASVSSGVGTEFASVTEMDGVSNGQYLQSSSPIEASYEVLSEISKTEPVYSDMRINKFMAEADPVPRSFEKQNFTEEELKKAIESPLISERGGKSNSAIEKVAIENFGKEVQKLKENVNSFKDNLRKILFEGESGMNAKSSEHQTMPSTSDHHLENGMSQDESLKSMSNNNIPSVTSDVSASVAANPKFNNDSNAEDSSKIPLTDGTTQNRSSNASAARIPPDFSKVSAVASNISEVSRRVGAFLQKQYRESSAGSKARAQNDIISRGAEDMVGVEPSSNVLRQWVNLEESFRESVDAVVRQALPLLVRASSEMQLTNPCYTSFFQLLLGLRRLRPWAFHMIDAFGKPPAGMLQGTVTSFGAYDECVNIVAMSDAKRKMPAQQYFRGKYCTVEIKPPLPPKPQYYTMYQPVSILANFSSGDDNVIRQAARQAHAFYFLNYRMDVCVPSTCTQEDVNNMAQFAAKYIDIEVAVPRCSVKENLLFDKSQVIILIILGVLLSFVVFGTSLDTLREMFHKTKLITQCLNNILAKLLLSFSLNTNASILLSTDSAQSGLSSVHGMRFFGMGWLVLGHTYFNSNIQMYGNLSEASAFAEGFLFQIIVNSTVSIDTFFFISAVLLSYTTLQSTTKDRYFSIPLLFIKRIIRTLPPYMLVIGGTLLLPNLGSGPFWNETVDPVVDACKQNWWTNLLFINNFVTTPGQRCLEHSWYISCDFQLFVIALFILFALIKRPVVGMILNVMMILVSMVMTGLLTFYYKVPPTLLASFPDPEERKFLNHVIISKPFCHLGPYCVGLATGYFFYRCKEIKLKPFHHVVGWGSAITVTAAVVYGVLEWNKGHLPSTTAALAYAATHRTAWALGLAWITIICVAGYGGLINRVLSWKVFIPLSRLTCMVYLIHPLIQYILTGYIRERLQTNHIILAYFFFSHIMTSYALAAGCFFLFDGPVEAIMRLLLGDSTDAPVPEISITKKGSNNNISEEKQRNM